MSPRHRVRWLVMVVVLLVLGLGGSAAGWHFWLRRPVGAGPVRIDVSREAFAAAWTEGEVFLVGMGDSITAGFGASPGRSYFDRLIRNPPGEFPELRGIALTSVLPRLRSTNLSISGSTSLQHEKAQLPRLARQPTNTFGLVVMTTGGNDLIHNYGQTPPVEGSMFGATWDQAQTWVQNFEARLERILNRVEDSFPGGCRIFIANIYDPSDGTGDLRPVLLPRWPDGLRLHAAYNQVIHAVAQPRANVTVVDIHRPFLGHGIYCTQFWLPHYDRADPHHWYLENVEDPNDRGYDALRRLFLNAIAKEFAPGR